MIAKDKVRPRFTITKEHLDKLEKIAKWHWWDRNKTLQFLIDFYIKNYKIEFKKKSIPEKFLSFLDSIS